MSDPVSAVLFDLDGTLVRYCRPPDVLLQEAFESVGTGQLFPIEAYYDRFDEFAECTDSMAELRRECFAALCSERGHDPGLGRRVADAYAAARDHRNVEYLAGARRVLDQFSEQYSIGIVTNGSRDAQRQKLESAGVATRADTVVFAGHDTPAKPAPEPFSRALDDLGVSPEETIHVGDSVASDVAGANAAGLTSVLLVSDGNETVATDGETADHVIHSLPELRALPWVERL